ncbi:carbohydrate binding domain-containing protein [candidate division KSB1 bacterium]|nr:carbohydrate binding domain-containing protein [candidate division KSB1 bacterium]
MKVKQSIIPLLLIFLMTTSYTLAQQAQSLTKIRVDENGNIEFLDPDVKGENTEQSLQLIQAGRSTGSGSLAKPAALPDLSYFSESYSFSYPNLHIQANIANMGTATANNIEIKFKLSNDTQYHSFGVKLGLKTLSTLPPNTYTTVTFDADLTGKCGTWYVVIDIDEYNQVEESNENNNKGYIEPTFFVDEGCQADLACWVECPYDSIGPVIDFGTCVYNRGDLPFWQEYEVNVFLSADANITLSDYLIHSWSTFFGYTDLEQCNFPGPITIPDHIPGGRYYLGVYVDVNDVIAESDETNNSRYYTFRKITVPAPPTTHPDLIVTNVTVTDATGPEIECNYSVKNQGDGGTGKGFTNYIYLSTDQTITQTDYRISEKQTNALNAGATHNSGEIPITVSGVPAGDYYLGVYADGSGIISESDENNNTRIDNTPKVNIPPGFEEPEEPAGNLIANWNFANGMSDWIFNAIGSGNGSSSVENGVFHAQISNGGTNVWDLTLHQEDLTIENGSTYTAIFYARADGPRDIQAWVSKVTSPHTLYKLENFSLTSEWQVFTYTFTMYHPTNNEAHFGFDLGTSDVDVYLDNISLFKEKALPPSTMLSNGDFSEGLKNWQFITMGSGNATGLVEGGAFHAQITGGGDNVWEVTLHQYDLRIVNGNTYTATFDARAASPRNINAWVAMNTEPWTLYNSDVTFPLTTEWQTFTFTFTMNYPTNPEARIGFDFGTSDIDVFLDYISLVEKVPSTGVQADDQAKIVKSYNLYQNYPNPFNPETTIGFDLPKTEMVTLKIYDITGKEITTLINKELPAGRYTVVFNGKDIASGVYFISFRTPDFSQYRKMLLLR